MPSSPQSTDLVVVALQLLMKTLVALFHLLLVTDQRCQAVQRPRVQIISVTPHHSTQCFCLTNHLRPGLRDRDKMRPARRPDLSDKS